MLNRDEAVAIARDAVRGASVVGPDGTETKLPDVLNPDDFNPPAWVIDAIRSGFQRGVACGRRLEHEDTIAAVLT